MANFLVLSGTWLCAHSTYV